MSEQKLVKNMMGINQHVTDKEEWNFLLFYDIDNHNADLNLLRDLLDSFKISYIVYKTKNGFHIIGLTPIRSAKEWGIMFDDLQKLFPEYYNGQTIRIWRKQGEVQELLFWNLDYPVISNLLQKFDERFNYSIGGNRIPVFTKERWYLIHERYWTGKL